MPLDSDPLLRLPNSAELSSQFRDDFRRSLHMNLLSRDGLHRERIKLCLEFYCEVKFGLPIYDTEFSINLIFLYLRAW